MRFSFPVLGNMLRPALLAVFAAFMLIVAAPAPKAAALPVFDDECKLEGNLIGVEGATIEVNGQTVTFSNWVLKDGETDEYIGFDVDTSSLMFTVKAGNQVYSGSGDSWTNPNGTGGNMVMAISNVDFCMNDGDSSKAFCYIEADNDGRSGSLDGISKLTADFTGTEIYGGTWNAGVVQYNALTNEWNDYGLSDMPVVAFAMHPQTETLVIGTSGSGVFLAPNMKMSTDVEDEVIGSEIPNTFALEQNYPNPFNPQTTIPFDLRETTRVKMAVYDMLGRQVGMLVDGTLAAGQHQVTWDAGDVPSGTYLVRMEAGGQTFTRTMILLK